MKYILAECLLLCWLSVSLDSSLQSVCQAQEKTQKKLQEKNKDKSLKVRVWKVDDKERQALIYIPDVRQVREDEGKNAIHDLKQKGKEEEMPLVFVFHGHGGSMRNSANQFKIHRLWPEACVVYMQGLPTPGRITDLEGKRNGWQFAKGEQQDRDLHFFDVVLSSLKKEYPIDRNRIYATGHSNGGAFTYLLWGERWTQLTAVAPSGAAIIEKSFLKFSPLPILHVAGEKDPIVLFRWQEKMMGLVRKLNQCEETGKPWAKEGQIVGTIYPSRCHATFVSLIYPGPHSFPSETPGLIVRFFKEQSKKQKLQNK